MSEYATIEHYVNHVMDEITKCDVEQVSERLRALGWEEVVRCRDCKHRAGANVQAVISDLCMWLNIIVKPDDFCAWGERRTKLDDARNVQ